MSTHIPGRHIDGMVRHFAHDANLPPERICADCGCPLGRVSGQYGPDVFLCGPCHDYEQDYRDALEGRL